MGGMAKGHPDAEELEQARRFYQSLGLAVTDAPRGRARPFPPPPGALRLRE